MRVSRTHSGGPGAVVDAMSSWLAHGGVSERSVGLAQGAFNVVGGLWPLVSLRSFEWVYGKKRDIFLQKTVGALLFSIGCVQLAAARSPAEMPSGRRLGIATAFTLLAVDLAYIPKGEMRWTYWQDALCEVGWLVAWMRTTPSGDVDVTTE